MTSSYSSTLLRDWKFRLSTVVWEFSMALVSILLSRGVSSSRAIFSIMFWMRSPPKRRSRSSSREM